MHDLPLLVNITLALGYALAGGLIARRLGLPTIVGYMVAGMALGPFTPGFQGDPDAIGQMAEFGVILLMFGVGLHFNLSDLWQVRRVAIPGAAIQLTIVAAIGYGVARWWGMPPAGAAILGIALAVASTVVQLRALMDHGWLDSPAGKVAVGWLVVEDLLMVAILVLLPVLAGPSTSAPGPRPPKAIGLAVLFVALMMVAGARVVPWILARVVHTRSRELFVLVALTVAVGTALASAHFFGVSLALGAFVAGIVVSESPFSNQIGADLLPFREAFAVVFFVSVGMLVNPWYVVQHWAQLLTPASSSSSPRAWCPACSRGCSGCSGRTTLVLAAGRGQIGEFSFILGQSGIALGALTDTQYSLILAGAIVSITVNPLMMRAVEPAEQWLRKRRPLWQLLDRGPAETDTETSHTHKDHVVIVGCGRVGRHIAETLKRLEIPRLVIESDPIRVDKLRELGVPVMYGEADNSEILAHASLATARALVITLPDDAAALAVVATARKQAPGIDIISRASTWDGGKQLRAYGVRDVVRPELEGGIEIVRRTLLELKLPIREIYRYTDLIRHEGIDESERQSAKQARVLQDIVSATRDLEIGWIEVGADSDLNGRRLADAGCARPQVCPSVGIGRGSLCCRTLARKRSSSPATASPSSERRQVDGGGETRYRTGG
jgi:CPA2 family monovalent cation:H+ antiporter-2